MYVVTERRNCGEKLRDMVDSIGAYPCVVTCSTKGLKEVNKASGIKTVLLDRSLDDANFKRLADLGANIDIATFGVAQTATKSLATIEASARYQFRHPVRQKDLDRFFGQLDSAPASRQSLVSNRSAHLYRGLVGDSDSVRELRDLIDKIAPSKSTVLITGETGTGKEIVARNIHYRSQQSTGLFVPVNCSAIPPDLLESELFGHKKGAFTGAVSDREGRFKMAAGGTLFLDEIGDMPPALQVKLLRVLEERIIYQVGSNKPISMTARLVAATHRNLEDSIGCGNFREDLFYRLNVVPIEVPPLRERKTDIPHLVKELICRLQREDGISVSLTSAAIDRLQTCDWPGNVRELANLIERLAVIHPNGIADIADLPDSYRQSADNIGEQRPGEQRIISHSLTPHDLPEDGIDLKDFLKSTEAALIRQALDHSDGTMSKAANLLHVGRTTLTEKVKRLGLTDLVKKAS